MLEYDTLCKYYYNFLCETFATKYTESSMVTIPCVLLRTPDTDQGTIPATVVCHRLLCCISLVTRDHQRNVNLVSLKCIFYSVVMPLMQWQGF